MPAIKTAIIMIGTKIHNTKNRRPTTKTKTMEMLPIVIRIILIKNPIVLIVVLIIKTEKKSNISNPERFFSDILFQGSNNVEKRKVS